MRAGIFFAWTTPHAFFSSKCCTRRIYTQLVHPSLAEIDWLKFLRRPLLNPVASRPVDELAKRSLLITGAGGSIGSELAARCAAFGPRKLCLLEASESRLFQLHQQLSPTTRTTQSVFMLGNLNDPSLLDEIFAQHAPDLIFHAAAFKHVPLLEEQPLAAIANNVLATEILANAAAEHGARLVLLSTDKAVMPISLLGATKRAAEQVVLQYGGVAVRLGNVLASSDSVTEIFAHQIAQGGPITVTDPAARRFFLTLDEAAEMLLAASSEQDCVLTPAIHEQNFIADLARFLAEELAPGRTIPITFTQLRAGDREKERLWSPEESARSSSISGMFHITSPRIPRDLLDDAVSRMRRAVATRDRAAALDALSSLVPEYALQGTTSPFRRSSVMRVAQ